MELSADELNGAFRNELGTIWVTFEFSSQYFFWKVIESIACASIFAVINSMINGS